MKALSQQWQNLEVDRARVVDGISLTKAVLKWVDRPPKKNFLDLLQVKIAVGGRRLTKLFIIFSI